MFYRRLGGRPWTYIVRDFAKGYPALMYLAFLGLGLVAGRGLGWTRLRWVLLGLGLGIVFGHFFWQ